MYLQICKWELSRGIRRKQNDISHQALLVKMMNNVDQLPNNCPNGVDRKCGEMFPSDSILQRTFSTRHHNHLFFMVNACSFDDILIRQVVVLSQSHFVVKP